MNPSALISATFNIMTFADIVNRFGINYAPTASVIEITSSHNVSMLSLHGNLASSIFVMSSKQSKDKHMSKLA